MADGRNFASIVANIQYKLVYRDYHYIFKRPKAMKLKYIILYVESVTKTIHFYNEAFGFATKFIHDAEDYGEIDTGDTVLAFSSLKLMTELGKNPAQPIANNPVFEIAFETPDVKSSLDHAVSCGANLVQAPIKQPWGQTTAYVSDINGFLIEICTAVGEPAS